jgi:L-seryl-tRNA(Ser) seleniumtransferase
VAAVRAILQRFVIIDELHAAASRVIARATGAEAGYVTSSSASAVALAAAAAITGDDLAAIEALPDTGGRERRIGLMTAHMVNYGGPVPQAIAASGAAVVPLGTAALWRFLGPRSRRPYRSGRVSHHGHEGELRRRSSEICPRSVPVIDVAAGTTSATPWPARRGDGQAQFLGGTTSGIVAGRASMIGRWCSRTAGWGG